MNFKEKITKLIMDKVASVSMQQRDIGEVCKKFSIDSGVSPDYIAIGAYKEALTDLLDEIRRIDVDSKSSTNIRRGRGS